MKRFKSFFLPALVAATIFTACKDKDDNPTPNPGGGNPPPATSRKVVYKAITSDGANVGIAVYGNDGNLTTANSLSGSTWTSPEVTLPASADYLVVTANASSTSTTATLKVQIIVDGQVKKEGTSSGSAMSASANYSLKTGK